MSMVLTIAMVSGLLMMLAPLYEHQTHSYSMRNFAPMGTVLRTIFGLSPSEQDADLLGQLDSEGTGE